MTDEQIIEKVLKDLKDCEFDIGSILEESEARDVIEELKESEDKLLTIKLHYEDKIKKLKKQLQIRDAEIIQIIETWKNELFGIIDYHKNHGSGEIIMRAELIKKIQELLQKIEEMRK